MVTKQQPNEKSELHARNKHRNRYDFRALIASYPDLQPFVKINNYGDESVDFFDPKAVLLLNKALLIHFYGIRFWEIPNQYLCPPIPGRADYIHYVADLLGTKNLPISCLDIGVGANCIYPIIGTKEYDWQFLGTDIDPKALAAAQQIVDNNQLNHLVELRQQHNHKKIFEGVVKPNEYFDVSICNPPFHASAKEAEAVAQRKLTNLTKQKHTSKPLNFGGKSNELWCEGGELRFLEQMIWESQQFRDNVGWFTSLVSKKENLGILRRILKEANAKHIKTIEMSQGNKISRILAWSFGW